MVIGETGEPGATVQLIVAVEFKAEPVLVMIQFHSMEELYAIVTILQVLIT